MSLLIQHGYGKSDKIERALRAGDVAGVIYSPRSESPRNLVDYIEKIAETYPNATQIIDPQFYASTVIGGKMGKLVDYDYFTPELRFRNFRSATEVSRYVRSTLDFQNSAAVSHYCSPTVCIDAFNDRWAAIAINLAAESIAYHSVFGDDRALLVSLTIHEQALRSREQLDEFLDEITDLECDGFYIVLRHEASNYSQNINSSSLEGLLYAIHVLQTLNEFEVYVGYSDYSSALFHAAGATATACGWNNGLKRFSFGRFEPQGGGRRPKPRYSSSPLLNSIPITPEFDAIARLRETASVLSGTPYDAAFARAIPSSVPWDDATSAMHNWKALHDVISGIEALRNTPARLTRVENMMTTAQALYTRLSRAGVPFDAAAGPGHLREWADGIREFRAHAGI